MTPLRVVDARKRFDTVQALDGVSLELAPRELLALLGPNGAGKTTLVRAVAGRVRLDGGRVELGGADSGGAHRCLGVVPQEIALYGLLTARENLDVFGRLHGLRGAALDSAVARALDWTALASRSSDLVKTFSGGMKRRLNIACGVLHEPSVVLLDEPTVGVDPQSRERIYEMLFELKGRGAALLLTTHQLEEAEGRCDRVVVLDNGREVAAGTVVELVERCFGASSMVAVTSRRELGNPPAPFTAEAGSRVLRASVADLGSELPGLLATLTAAGVEIENLEVRRPGLGQVFLALTGRELRE